MEQEYQEKQEGRLGTFLKPLADREFQYLSSLVYQYCGINLHEGKRELVRARLCKRLRELNLDSFVDYCRYLQEKNPPEEITLLLDTLSTNLTSFFREKQHFDFLQRELPNLLRQKKTKGSSRLRLWSTACSSGEEPYSMALVVAEAIVSTGVHCDVKILATDISSSMLRRAEAGCYSQERVKDNSPALKFKYFQYEDGQYTVNPELKKIIAFRKLNVIGPWPFQGPFDVIFCRNMMIYFDKETQLELVGRLHQCLTEDGYLFVGHSESLIGISHAFRHIQPTVYQRI